VRVNKSASHVTRLPDSRRAAPSLPPATARPPLLHPALRPRTRSSWAQHPPAAAAAPARRVARCRHAVAPLHGGSKPASAKQTRQRAAGAAQRPSAARHAYGTPARRAQAEGCSARRQPPADASRPARRSRDLHAPASAFRLHRSATPSRMPRRRRSAQPGARCTAQAASRLPLHTPSHGRRGGRVAQRHVAGRDDVHHAHAPAGRGSSSRLASSAKLTRAGGQPCQSPRAAWQPAAACTRRARRRTRTGRGQAHQPLCGGAVITLRSEVSVAAGTVSREPVGVAARVATWRWWPPTRRATASSLPPTMKATQLCPPAPRPPAAGAWWTPPPLASCRACRWSRVERPAPRPARPPHPTAAVSRCTAATSAATRCCEAAGWRSARRRRRDASIWRAGRPASQAHAAGGAQAWSRRPSPCQRISSQALRVRAFQRPSQRVFSLRLCRSASLYQLGVQSALPSRLRASAAAAASRMCTGCRRTW
jgi:hypothetical protein